MTTWTHMISREVSATDCGTINTLNDLPEWMVEEGRAVGRISLLAAYEYVKFYVRITPGSSAHDFASDVLCGNESAATWRIRDCVCIPLEPTATTALEIAYLKLFEGKESGAWVRIKPSLGPQDYSAAPGAVGILRHDVRYWHEAPEGLGYYAVTSDQVEPVAASRVTISVRRWIAHRLAWYTKQVLALQNDSSGDGILSAVPGAEMSRVTLDATIAARALAREAVAYAGSPQFPEQAGFLGPDEWYE